MNFGRILIFTIFLFFSKKAYSQVPKPIYFLADTLGVDNGNRILEMGNEGAWQYYNFYCRCIRNYDRDIVFAYRREQGTKHIHKDKPAMQYISWKELSELIWNEGKNFDKKYALHIVEALPDNQFLTNKVMMFLAELKY